MKEVAVLDKYIMNGNKLNWHLERVADWLNGNRIPPIHIDVNKCYSGCRTDSINSLLWNITHAPEHVNFI